MALLGGYPTMGWGPIPSLPVASRCQERRLHIGGVETGNRAENRQRGDGKLLPLKGIKLDIFQRARVCQSRLSSNVYD